jgi:AcrR family transcriptional regulator
MVTDRGSSSASSPAPGRARTPGDKEARRRRLLGAAWELFRATDYEAITVAEVAAKAGLAKGTVYLYFGTKEELFLEVAGERLADWIDAVDARLGGPRPPAGPAAIARVFSETLRPRGELLRFLGILHSVLERNAGDGPILAFKRAVLARVGATGALLERRLPALRAGEGGRLLLRIYALIIGLWPLASPGPVVARVLAAPELAPMRLDFERELDDTVTAILAGMEKKGGRR